MVLDNPLWASLTTVHRGLALPLGHALRYPAEVAPFAAMAGPGPAPRGAGLFLLGPRPEGAEELGPILQMICEAQQEQPPGPVIEPLDEAHRAAVLELTALVYPHYF